MQYMQKICCFFIFARVFLHMCPSEKYEKYINALTGWVALCVFLSPFLSTDMLSQSYEAFEKEWKTYFSDSFQDKRDELEDESLQVAEELARRQCENFEKQKNENLPEKMTEEAKQ